MAERMMKRRAFLLGAGAVAASPLLPPLPVAAELPLTTVELPIAATSNQLLTADVIVREAIRILETQVAMGGVVSRGYDEEFSGKVWLDG